ncbi:MAG TPA: histidine phosphatase family protein [Vicinamibacterales bacterium]|nr:histidine phosphatase family protein [Vicinamibacterales bacterium]
MSRQLLVLRHAKSSWADDALDDWERPLNQRGERDAPRVGALLRQLSLLPDLIVTSDAVRAETTARAVAEAAGYEGRIVLSPELYHAGPDAIVNVLRELKEPLRAVMIVGHNPGLEDLVGRLTGERIDLPTATLVHLQLPVDKWADVRLTPDAALIDVWRPREI